MHDATASTPRLIASWTTGAARSTSHVVNTTSAPCPSSLAAHAFAIAALFPCVSHVLSWSLRPVTPPFAFNWLTRSFAAASAGLSNGAIAPLLSNAQPITIGVAAGPVVRAAAVAASATTAASRTTSVSPRRELVPLMCTPSLSAAAAATDGMTGGSKPNLACIPRALERRACARQQLGRRLVPQRVAVRGAEGAVVGEDLDVV